MVTAARGVVVALSLMLLAPVASAAEQESFYLGTDGFPRGSLVPNPRGGEMPNFDPGRDIEPGLFLERSALGLAETEDTKYQQWQLDMGGQTIEGHPSLVIWSAPARFDPSRAGALTAYLLDCNRLGSDCRHLGTADVVIDRGSGHVWVESRLDFEPIDHTFGAGRFMGVRIVVPDGSESDMMLAYGFPHVRSRLTIFAEAPPPVVDPVDGQSVSAPDVGDLLAEHKLIQGFDAPVQAAEVESTETPLTWIVSLVLSTAMLLVLGTFLVSRLTKPGKHERRPPSDPGDLTQTERLTVSAR
ncbi:MAG: hypothetical protein ACRDZM_13360 [Acidimicrobiia bacterium]